VRSIEPLQRCARAAVWRDSDLQLEHDDWRSYGALPKQTLTKENRVTPTLIQEMSDALERYFDLMYDCDVQNFDRVFASTAQLHGFREGEMNCWGAAHYKEVLAGRTSPKAQGAPRETQVLLLDFTSATQALAKVRVRINDMFFVDYLSYHKIAGTWLVTSKAYHLEA
jgi:hypothetical protein